MPSNPGKRFQFLQQPAWPIGITWLLLLVHAWYYWPFLSDDTLISLRYADRLVDGLGLTWTSGKPVEGFSNFSWVLLHAGLHALGLDLIVACRILSLGMMLALPVVIFRSKIQTLTGTALNILLLSSAPFAIWAIGGLETGLFALLIAISLNLSGPVILKSQPKDWWLLSFALGVLCLTRPEGPLICVILFAGVLIGRHQPGGSWLREALTQWRMPLIPLIAYGCLLAFRLWYYGEWFPNTAYARVAPGYIYVKMGIKYVLTMLAFTMPVLLFLWPFFPENSRKATQTPYYWPVFLIATAWILYLLFIGGDYFPGYRQGFPLLICLAIVARETRYPSFPLVSSSFQARMLPLMLILFIGGQWLRPELQDAKYERWEWDLQVLANALKETYGDRNPLIAVTAAGAIPYWTGFEAIDLYGLNDYHIARHKPDDVDRRDIGHGLSDPGYVMQRKPDILVFFWGEKEPVDGPGHDLLELSDFRNNYRPVILRGSSPYAYEGTIWVRKGF